MDGATRRARFEQVIAPHYPILYRTARRLARSDPDGQDLVQETCLRAFRTFDGFTPGTNAKAWLFTILYSVFINRTRRARHEPEPMPGDQIDARYAGHVEASVAAPVVQWTEPEVERALDALPDTFRAAVLLVDVEELTYEEAATVLTCPVGTVRSRLFRGRKLLMVSLAEFASRAGFAVVKEEGR